MVEIHKLPIGIWYIHVPSKAIAVAARTSSVESRGAVPESDEYEKIQIMHSLNQSNTGKALIFHIFFTYLLYLLFGQVEQKQTQFMVPRFFAPTRL